MRLTMISFATVAIWCAAAGHGEAQSRTIESANEFLELMSNRDTAEVGIFKIDRYQASGCSAVIDGHWFNPRAEKITARITLNWAEFTEVAYPASSDRTFEVFGPVRTVASDSVIGPTIRPSASFRYESASTANRASTAVQFLIESCDRSQGFGF